MFSKKIVQILCKNSDFILLTLVRISLKFSEIQCSIFSAEIQILRQLLTIIRHYNIEKHRTKFLKIARFPESHNQVPPLY
jgi:hypothetical protein